MLLDSLHGLPKKVVYFISLLVWLGISFFLAYSGGKLTLIILQQGQVSPAMRMPMAFAYASVPVGCLLMCVRLVEQIVTEIRTQKPEREAE